MASSSQLRVNLKIHTSSRAPTVLIKAFDRNAWWLNVYPFSYCFFLYKVEPKSTPL